MITKKQLRLKMEKVRRTLSGTQRADAEQKIAQQVQCLNVFQQANIVALYMAFGGEVQLESLFPICWALEKRTCIPVYDPQTQLYDMAEIHAKTHFITGKYGILEPKFSTKFPTEQIDLMLVPGVAFDRKGNRLGRGGGYYDRLLQHVQGTTIGVAYDWQIVPQIPCEAHDIPVGGVITPTKTWIKGNEY